MRITNVGYNHFHDADFFVDRPEGSGDYLILLLKTAGIFFINGREVEAKANSVLFYKKGTPQLYKASGAQFGNDWLHFLPDNDEDEKFLAALGIPFDTVIGSDSIAELSVFISMMCHENYSANIFKADSVDLLIKLFLIKLSEKINMSAKVGLGDRYEKMSVMRAKIYNMPSRGWTIDRLAHELTMSRSSFQHLYKQMFGVTPMNDVIAGRIEHAKYLLRSTGFTVTHIAQMCGYSSDIHFMRQFRQRTGMTPSEYRGSGSEK